MQRNRKTGGRRVKTRFWVYLFGATLLVFAISFGILQARYSHDSRALAEQRAYRDQLKLHVSDLSAQVEYVQSDEYIMRTAREQLGMILPGEVRYVNGAQ